MYRKEECMSLLKDPEEIPCQKKDPEEDEASDDDANNSDEKPAVRWHKVRLALKDYGLSHVEKRWEYEMNTERDYAAGALGNPRFRQKVAPPPEAEVCT